MDATVARLESLISAGDASRLLSFGTDATPFMVQITGH